MLKCFYRYFVLAVWFIPIASHAQFLTAPLHKPHYTDSLTAYEQPYRQVADSGNNCVWDFSDLQNDTMPVFVDYYALSKTDTMLMGVHKAHINYRLHLIADTLFIAEYETSKTIVSYTKPDKDLCFPFTYRDSLHTFFAGNGMYCHLFPFSITGHTAIYCDAMGKLILSDLTLDSILRIHTIRYYQEIARDTINVISDTYRWYSKLIRYPLFETTKVTTIREKDTAVVAMAYYLPQELDNHHQFGNPNPKIDKSVEDGSVTELSYMPNPVYSDLTISYRLAKDANVFVSIHYNGGVSMYATPVQWQNEGYNSLLINMQNYPVGTYVLYLHVDDIVIGQTIIKI